MTDRLTVTAAGETAFVDFDTDPGFLPAWGLPVKRDEFAGAIDTALWAASAGAVATDTDGYRQANNVFTSGGNLTLRAVKLASPITAPNGSIRTWGSAWADMNYSQRYGRWEFKFQSLKPLQSRGIWPGGWMRADGGGFGEIDLNECVGTPCAHPDYTNNGAKNQARGYQQTGDTTKPCTPGVLYDLKANPDGTYYGWHTAAFEWTPNRMTVFSDDRKVWEIDRRAATPNATTVAVAVAIMDVGFPTTAHLRYTQHVGSAWAGSPDANTLSPYDTLVDYVRVWPYTNQQ